jgi:hypothetical protein
VHRAHNLTSLMCRLSRNLGALTSWTPQGHVGLFQSYFTFSLFTYFQLNYSKGHYVFYVSCKHYGIDEIINSSLEMDYTKKSKFIKKNFETQCTGCNKNCHLLFILPVRRMSRPIFILNVPWWTKPCNECPNTIQQSSQS